MDFREIVWGSVEWIKLARDRDRRGLLWIRWWTWGFWGHGFSYVFIQTVKLDKPSSTAVAKAPSVQHSLRLGCKCWTFRLTESTDDGRAILKGHDWRQRRWNNEYCFPRDCCCIICGDNLRYQELHNSTCAMSITQSLCMQTADNKSLNWKLNSLLHWGLTADCMMGWGLRLWTAATNGHIVHPPDDIWVCRTTVEWYWQGKPEEFGENLSQCDFVHHKSHMDWPGREPGTQRWEAGV
jgi:hypothetical protein